MLISFKPALNIGINRSNKCLFWLKWVKPAVVKQKPPLSLQGGGY